MNLSISVNDIEAEGLDAVLVKSIVAAGYEEGKGMPLPQVFSVAKQCQIPMAAVTDALRYLQHQKCLVVEETPLGSVVAPLVPGFEINPSTSRRLRQYGVSPTQLKSLKEDFRRTVVPQEQTQQSFMSFALRYLKESTAGVDQTWRPSTKTLNHLRAEGVGTNFIDSAVLPFLEKYDPEKGGGDIDTNFLRFVTFRWKNKNREMPEAWLPSTGCNRILLDQGFKQKEILLSALEFRIWARERRMIEHDWDNRFIEYMEKLPSVVATGS